MSGLVTPRSSDAVSATAVADRPFRRRAIAGVTALVAVTSAAAVVSDGLPAGLAAFVTLVLFGAVGDYRGARVPLSAGALFIAVATSLGLIGGLSGVTSLLAGAAAGLVLPAAIALAARAPRSVGAAPDGDPARVTILRLLPALLAIAVGVGASLLPGTAAGFVAAGLIGVAAALAPVDTRATPRLLLPLPLSIPRASRGAYRAAIVLMVAAATVATASPIIGLAYAAIPLALGSIVLALRAAAPLSWSATMAAVLARGALAVATLGLVSLVAPWPVVAAVGLVLAIILAPRGPQSSARLDRPGSMAFRAATKTYDTSPTTRPDVAAIATTADQVSALVADAGTAGLGVRVHSTGHAAGTAAPFDRSALLKVRIDEPLTMDRDAHTVRIPAGTTWGDVVRLVTPARFGVPHGAYSGVGAIGYLLRGGMSFYGRSLGVAANSIESIELVLADGSTVIADRIRNTELFWALRGGGGGFGIVTAVTVRMFDLAAVVTGTTFWSIDHARDLATAWVQLNEGSPRELTTALRVLQLPALPGLPRSITGRPTIAIDGVALVKSMDDLAGAQRDVGRVMDPLRAIAEPVLDTWKPASPFEVPVTHMDPPVGIAHVHDHQLVAGIDGDGIEAFMHAVDPADPGISIAELRHLGGAFAEGPGDGGAVSTFDGDYSTFIASSVTKKNSVAQARQRLERVRSAMGPWDTGTVIPTFAPERSIPQRPFGPEVARRVAEIRSQVDPSGVFAQEVAPGTNGAEPLDAVSVRGNR